MTHVRDELSENIDFARTASQLRASYTRINKNPQRLNFFDMNDYFVQHRSEVEKFAWLVFEYELIEQEYSMMSPEVSHGWIYNSGSQIYTELHKILGDISLNKRVIILSVLWNIVEKDLPYDALNCQTQSKKSWPELKDLAGNIESVLNHLIRVKSKANLNNLLRAIPDLDALRNNITALYENYHSAKKATNPKREAALTFIDFISSNCDLAYKNKYANLSPEEKKNNPEYIKSRNVYFGMMLLLLLQVQAEYKFNWLWSANHSVLFREALVAMGYTSLDEIPLEEKIEWLWALGNFLDETKLKSKEQQWQNRNLTDLEVTLTEVRILIADLEAEKTKPSFVGGLMKSGASTAVSYVFERAIVQYAVVPVISTAIAGAVAGPLGAGLSMAFSPLVTTFIMSMANKYIPSTANQLVSSLFGKISSKLGDGVAAASFALFAVSKDGLKNLLGFYQKHVDEKLDPELAIALLSLSDDMMSAQEKKRICKANGWPEPNRLFAAHPKVTINNAIVLLDNYQPDNSPKVTKSSAYVLMMFDGYKAETANHEEKLAVSASAGVKK